jgi:CRP/FNR family transcriptional regulator
LLELSGGGREILLPMTKGDLASQLGMTQETLSRKLSALQEDGLIRLKGRRKIIIENKEELEKLIMD